MQKTIHFRYVFVIDVFFMLVNSFFFIMSGVALSIHGYIEFAKIGFLPNEEIRPGLFLLESLDAFMVSLVFMIFGIGMANIFLFDKVQTEDHPAWLNISNLGELKTLMWKTILFTMVVFAVTKLAKVQQYSWESLIFPLVILILSAAFFLVHYKKQP
ncbi:MAG: putative membrane protein YqhA [Pirellulaceae bacterium]|jgi:uncharacterized membrane protein YqhA